MRTTCGGSGLGSGLLGAVIGGTVEVHGGIFRPVMPAYNFNAFDSSTIKFFGCAFDGYPAYGDVTAQAGRLNGTLENGQALVNTLFFRYTDGILTLVEACDSDHDGVLNSLDQCPNSDLRPTVYVLECDSGVPNVIGGLQVDANGCSLADRVAGILSHTAAQNPQNHGKFVSASAKGLNTLVVSGVITLEQHAALMQCVAASK